MTLNAHVPARSAGQEPQVDNPSAFFGLGAKLIELGRALQSDDSTVGELTGMAKACGMELRLKVVGDVQ